MIFRCANDGRVLLTLSFVKRKKIKVSFQVVCLDLYQMRMICAKMDHRE